MSCTHSLPTALMLKHHSCLLSTQHTGLQASDLALDICEGCPRLCSGQQSGQLDQQCCGVRLSKQLPKQLRSPQAGTSEGCVACGTYISGKKMS